MKQTIIVGGGLAGLICGIELSKKGVPCRLFEKKKYPFHRVCGEYVSNEALPYLKSINAFPEYFQPSSIHQFQLSSVRGQSATLPLDLGGFGISRFNFDHFLYQVALQQGVEFHLNTEVSKVDFNNNSFIVKTDQEVFQADLVLGAFGKRSKLDVRLNRAFIKKRSPYVGIKYHVKSNHPDGLISLHNFEGGYCGVVNIEKQTTNICYLVKRDVLQRFKNIGEMERQVLFQNPFLKNLFEHSEFLHEKPEVINEVSFATKDPVDHHILMLGDAAGMITPLCGNGMAMAIHSGKIASELVVKFCEGTLNRPQLEETYSKLWTKSFGQRLRTGRMIQKLFGNSILSDLAVRTMVSSKPIANLVMKNTHGKKF